MTQETTKYKTSEIKRKRDFQRSRLYSAQTRLLPAGLSGRQFDPDGINGHLQIESYLKRVVESDWFKKRWPYIISSELWVMNGEGPTARGGATTDNGYVIKLPSWAREERLALHELAHVCTLGDAHGKVFAGVLLELIRYWMGQTAAAMLEDGYTKNIVRWTPYEVGALMPIQIQQSPNGAN